MCGEAAAAARPTVKLSQEGGKPFRFRDAQDEEDREWQTKQYAAILVHECDPTHVVK